MWSPNARNAPAPCAVLRDPPAHRPVQRLRIGRQRAVRLDQRARAAAACRRWTPPAPCPRRPARWRNPGSAGPSRLRHADAERVGGEPPVDPAEGRHQLAPCHVDEMDRDQPRRRRPLGPVADAPDMARSCAARSIAMPAARALAIPRSTASGPIGLAEAELAIDERMGGALGDDLSVCPARTCPPAAMRRSAAPGSRHGCHARPGWRRAGGARCARPPPPRSLGAEDAGDEGFERVGADQHRGIAVHALFPTAGPAKWPPPGPWRYRTRSVFGSIRCIWFMSAASGITSSGRGRVGRIDAGADRRAPSIEEMHHRLHAHRLDHVERRVEARRGWAGRRSGALGQVLGADAAAIPSRGPCTRRSDRPARRDRQHDLVRLRPQGPPPTPRTRHGHEVHRRASR